MRQVLLVNFSKAEGEKFGHLPITFDRGYIGWSSARRGFVFHFPYSIHEYHAIIVKHGKVTDELRSEFGDLPQDLLVDDSKLFFQYMRNSGRLIILLNDHMHTDLRYVGIPDVVLEQVRTKDATIAIGNFQHEFLGRLYAKHRNRVVMPTASYLEIQRSEDSYFVSAKNGVTLSPIYTTRANKVLGAYQTELWGEKRYGLMILPMFRDAAGFIEDLLRAFAVHDRGFLPELYVADWGNSVLLYPRTVAQYEQRKQDIVSRMEAELAGIAAQEQAERDKYRKLPGLLTSKGNELKECVVWVLKDVLCFSVIDQDEKKQSSIAREDLLIEGVEVDGAACNIIVEVKGDGSPYPSSTHITQLWRHMQGHPREALPMLILNYDIDTSPTDRSLAYTGEHEGEIEGIIFVDTRVLHAIAVAVINGDVSLVDAQNLLKKKGRVLFV